MRAPAFATTSTSGRASSRFPGGGPSIAWWSIPEIIDFAERALDTTDLRVYQTGVSAKYTGITNYEQPMHTDRNHSWLPAVAEAPWRHIEGFLYLSDVGPSGNPTHLVSVRDSAGRPTTAPLIMPAGDPEIYAREKGAFGVRGSYLAYRSDVFHRAVELSEPGGSRFLLNVSYRIAGQDWIGYHSSQSNSTSPDWIRFAERSTPHELALFGFPPSGSSDLDDISHRGHAALLPETRPGSLGAPPSIPDRGRAGEGLSAAPRPRRRAAPSIRPEIALLTRGTEAHILNLPVVQLIG